MKLIKCLVCGTEYDIGGSAKCPICSYPAFSFNSNSDIVSDFIRKARRERVASSINSKVDPSSLAIAPEAMLLKITDLIDLCKQSSIFDEKEFLNLTISEIRYALTELLDRENQSDNSDNTVTIDMSQLLLTRVYMPGEIDILSETLSLEERQLLFSEYEKYAEQGNEYAQYNLGVLYEHGKGVKQNYAKAGEWYLKAAEQGIVSAQYNLGLLYENGRGVMPNYKKAAEWYQKAAEQGDMDSQFKLGLLYYNGQGVEKKPARAAAWFLKAALQGHTSSQYSLGVLYENGRGVDKNYTKAAEWYQKAAEQGDAVALNKLTKLSKKQSINIGNTEEVTG